MCPYCNSLTSGWVAASGRGTVWSFVIAHPRCSPPTPSRAPYNVAVITLDEDPGLRMIGNVVRTADGPIGELGPDDIAIGTPVRSSSPSPWRASCSEVDAGLTCSGRVHPREADLFRSGS